MKNKRINLFFGKKDYQDIQKYFRIFRFTLLGMTITLSLFVLILGYLSYIQKQKIDSKTQEKRNNLQLFNAQKEQEVKLIKITNKLKDYETFIKDDAEFYPYYSLLADIINKSEELPKIESLSMEKDRKFSFTLTFLTKENLIKAFHFVETEDFLMNFETINLKSFESVTNEKGSSYKITFEGKFKKLNENKN
jgi:hypothetical protein